MGNKINTTKILHIKIEHVLKRKYYLPGGCRQIVVLIFIRPFPQYTSNSGPIQQEIKDVEEEKTVFYLFSVSRLKSIGSFKCLRGEFWYYGI